MADHDPIPGGFRRLQEQMKSVSEKVEKALGNLPAEAKVEREKVELAVAQFAADATERLAEVSQVLDRLKDR